MLRPVPVLIAGPYRSPDVATGQIVRCYRRGLVRVTDWSPGVATTDLGAPLSWPLTGECAIAGRTAIIVTGDLVHAVCTESVASVAHHWGVARSTVTRIRSALSVGRWTPGTMELWSRVGSGKLTSKRAKRMAAQRWRD